MLSQYANSPVIVNLVNGVVEQINNAQTIDDWFRIVFDLRTATGFGLDLWGKILNQSRRFQFLDENNNVVDVYLQGEQTVDGVHYTDAQMEDMYRTVLFFRAFSYITNCSIKSMNELLQFYFKEKSVYVYEIGTMEIEVVFRFFINKPEKAIFASELFPKPTGVGLNFRYIPDGEWLGFFEEGSDPTEPDKQPFAPMDIKPFYPYDKD